MWRASRLRPTVVLVSGACALTSCAASPGRGASGGASTTGVSASLGGLSVSAVVNRRFVTTVDLDGGNLVIQPPGDTRAHLAPSTAQSMFAAADAATGHYPFALLGLGVVTISTSVPSAPDTLPGAAASSSSASSTTAPSSGTTSTTVSNTPTTASAPTSVATTTSTAPPVRLPAYNARLAWVGLAWGPACGSSDGRAQHPHLVAVVFDAQSGRDVVAYSSGAIGCGTVSQTPRVSVPEELVSVPWQPVGPASTAVVATLPACASYYGWTELSGPHAGAVQVVARRPYEPGCTPATEHTQTVDDVVPLGSGQSRATHAPLGPVDALRNLTSG